MTVNEARTLLASAQRPPFGDGKWIAAVKVPGAMEELLSYCAANEITLDDVRTETECTECDGTGEVECGECGHVGDCPECDGAGAFSSPTRGEMTVEDVYSAIDEARRIAAERGYLCDAEVSQ